MNVRTEEKFNQCERRKAIKDAAYGTIFRISQFFPRSTQKLYINFSVYQARLKV
jgi:hypothetical protein